MCIYWTVSAINPRCNGWVMQDLCTVIQGKNCGKNCEFKVPMPRPYTAKIVNVGFPCHGRRQREVQWAPRSGGTSTWTCFSASMEDAVWSWCLCWWYRGEILGFGQMHSESASSCKLAVLSLKKVSFLHVIERPYSSSPLSCVYVPFVANTSSIWSTF